MPRRMEIGFKVLLALLGVWLGLRYLLPLLLPFLLGGAVALAAEPLVGLLHRRGRLPRGLSAGVGVTVTLVMTMGLVSLLGAVLLKEVGRLAGTVPDLEVTARQGMTVLEDWLVGVAQQAPEGVRPVLTGTVLRVFDDGNALVDQVTQRIPGAVGAVLSRVPDSAIGAGTGLLAAFMISARLPQLRTSVKNRLPERFYTQYMPALRKARQAALGWLRAQGKLMLLTWGVVSAGFLLLGIQGGVLWAALVAVVDAVPMLGTGIVLLPWALVCLLQGQQLRALGLSILFVTATVARTALEPRLVGKQLGLDPLTTLLCLYVGYRLWGFLGLLLAPMLAGVLRSVFRSKPQ